MAHSLAKIWQSFNTKWVNVWFMESASPSMLVNPACKQLPVKSNRCSPHRDGHILRCSISRISSSLNTGRSNIVAIHVSVAFWEERRLWRRERCRSDLDWRTPAASISTTLGFKEQWSMYKFWSDWVNSMPRERYRTALLSTGHQERSKVVIAFDYVKRGSFFGGVWRRDLG